MNVRRCNITRVAIHEISGGAVRVFMCYSFLYKYVFAIIYRLAFLYIVVLFFVHHVQLIKQPERKRILFYYIILTIKKHCNYYILQCCMQFINFRDIVTQMHKSPFTFCIPKNKNKQFLSLNK